MRDWLRERWWRAPALGAVVLLLLLVVAYLARDWVPTYFNTDFHQLLTSNLIGVAVGAVFALWVDRLRAEERNRRQEYQEEVERREAARETLTALRKTVDHNDELVKQAISELPISSDAAVFFSTDPEALDPIISRVLDTTGDLELVRKASAYRYQLDHVGRKLEAQAEIYLRPQYTPQSSYWSDLWDRRRTLIESIHEHSEVLQETADDLRTRIEATREEHRAPPAGG